MSAETVEPTAIDDILDGKVKLEPVEPVTDIKEPSPDATGEQDEPAETPAQKDAPPASEAEDKTVPTHVMVAIRRENQELKNRLARIEQQREQSQTREPMPDPVLDPDGYTRAIEAQRFTDKAELSRDFMIEKVGEAEFVAAEKAFIQAAQHDKGLQLGLIRAANPARYAYDHGKSLIEAQQGTANGGSSEIAALKAQIEELKGMLTGLAQPAKAQPAPKSAPAVPSSIADARNQQPAVNGWTGPASWDDLLKPASRR